MPRFRQLQRLRARRIQWFWARQRRFLIRRRATLPARLSGENALKIRALLVDGVLKEWTTGDAHDVTDRSFVVRRVIKLNDALPGDKPAPGDKQATGFGSGDRGCWWTA